MPRSWAELQALDDRVTAVWVRLAREGHMEFLAAGADAATGREEISVVDLTPSKAAFLNAELGAGNIELVNGSLSDMPRAV